MLKIINDDRKFNIANLQGSRFKVTTPIISTLQTIAPAMAPQSAPAADLQDSTTSAAITHSPFLNDSNLMSDSTLQTKPLESIYIAGLICLALLATLCVGGFVTLLTGGLWKKLRPLVRENDSERGRNEEGSRWRELHQAIEERADNYTRHIVSLPAPHHRTRLHPIPEESEDATSIRSDRAYSTGIVPRPSDSLMSLSSLSSLGSLKTEEDISEADTQGQVFSRRLRKRDEANSLNSEATFFPSISNDTLKRGSELIEDEKSTTMFEVKMAKAQNIELTRARLVLFGLPLSEFRRLDAGLSVESASSSEGGYDSVVAASSCGSLSSVEISGIGTSSGM